MNSSNTTNLLPEWFAESLKVIASDMSKNSHNIDFDSSQAVKNILKLIHESDEYGLLYLEKWIDYFLRDVTSYLETWGFFKLVWYEIWYRRAQLYYKRQVVELENQKIEISKELESAKLEALNLLDRNWELR